MCRVQLSETTRRVSILRAKNEEEVLEKYTAEQIIGIVREAGILLADGETRAMPCLKLGISQQSYCGALRLDRFSRLIPG